MKRVLIALGVVGLVAPSLTMGQQYVPASKVIERMTAKAPATAPVAEKPGDESTLDAQIENFKKSVVTATPEQAAATWLELLDRALETKDEDGDGVEEQSAVARVMLVLPPPTAWPALRTAIEARPAAAEPAKRQDGQAVRERALKILAHLLANDPESLKNDVLALDALYKNARDHSPTQYLALQLAQQLGQDLVSPDLVVTQFEAQLGTSSEGFGSLEVPDLVTLVGREKAEALLRMALVAPSALEIRVGHETLQLARKLALELVNELKVPQWALVDLYSVKLYEAMDAKFSAAATSQPSGGGGLLGRIFGGGRRSVGPDYNDYRKRQATVYYMLGLIIDDRVDDAIKVARQLDSDDQLYLPYDALQAIDRAGHAQAVADMLHKLLAENPELPVWDDYRSAAVRTGQGARMLELARSAAARENLTDEQRGRIQLELYQALLAVDQVDEAVAVLQEMFKQAPGKDAAAGRGSVAVDLIRIGRLLDRPQWVEQGVVEARRSILDSATEQSHGYRDETLVRQFCHELVKLGRGPEAVELLADLIARRQQAAAAAAQADPSMRHRFEFRSSSPDGPQLLIALVSIYHRAGLHKDVLELMNTVPDWGAGDLIEIYTTEDGQGRPLGYIVAAALFETGKAQPARVVLDAVVDAEAGFDPAYELLAKVYGDDAIRRLDELFARDQFEERPLIWKAELLRRQGKLEDAERVIRQAIAIDPSDGEQLHGRRMRAYAVLADILNDRGDQKGADFHREVVKAIRISEDADVLYGSGLLQRGITMYREALTHFQDAYCIQSRLAVQLVEMGMMEAAEQHYQKAYELMPDSFGRMESHCFGCEGAFRGDRQQSIAERVFTKFAKDQPRKPQVHYLLGYLREQQGRYNEALDAFRVAVKLDPDYLNAWKHLADLGDNMTLSAADVDAATLNLLRLDPLMRHGRVDLRTMRDLRGLWAEAERAVAIRPAQPQALYPLTASAQKQQAGPQDGSEPQVRRWMHRDERSQWTSPAEFILATNAVRRTVELLSASREDR